MRNFKLVDGDLVLGRANRLETVSDDTKLLQDLKCWLLEPYGAGFMTPNFGSFIDFPGENGLIGKPIDSETEMELTAEIERILSLYQASQQEKIKLARYENILNVFSRKEILNRVKEITVQLNANRPDSYIVKIVIETASGQELALTGITGTEGVQIA